MRVAVVAEPVVERHGDLLAAVHVPVAPVVRDSRRTARHRWFGATVRGLFDVVDEPGVLDDRVLISGCIGAPRSAPAHHRT